MVRNHDPGDAVLDRQLGVRRRQDALEQDRHLGEAQDPVDRFPGHRRIQHLAVDAALVAMARGRPLAPPEVGAVQARGQLEAVAHLAVARAEHRRVDGDADRPAPRRLGPLHQVAGEGPVLLHVELEPERSGGDRRDVLDRGGGQRADHHRRAGGAGAARRLQLALRVGHAVIGGGGEENRIGQLCAEQLEGGVEAADVAQHARREQQLVERGAVAAQRDLVAGGAGEIVVDHGRQALPGHLFEVGDGDRFAAHGCFASFDSLASLASFAALAALASLASLTMRRTSASSFRES